MKMVLMTGISALHVSNVVTRTMVALSGLRAKKEIGIAQIVELFVDLSRLIVSSGRFFVLSGVGRCFVILLCCGLD